MDLSVPFFGNPNISRQGDKGRQNLKKEYEPSWLDSFLEGFFGGDAPAGSVLDPKADEKQTAKDIGRRAGVVTDIASPVKAGLLGALPALAGAIRMGGAKDLMLSHAFDARNAPKIAETGFLSAPSLAITSNSPNTFDKTRPQFVFRAGSVTPEQYPSSLINRDGWFSNPTGLRDSYSKRDEFNFPQATTEWSNKTFRESLKQAIKAAKIKEVFHNDLRLGQYSSPNDYDAKALAIFASPKFESLRSFEKSPEGAQLLRHSGPGSDHAWEVADEYAHQLARKFGDNPIETIIKHVQAGKPLEELPPEYLTLFKIQSRSPSDMAEFKIFDKLPLSPENAFIYAGERALASSGKSLLKELEPLQAQGFKVMTDATLLPPDLFQRVRGDRQRNFAVGFLDKRLPSIPNPQGTFSFDRTGLLEPEGALAGMGMLGKYFGYTDADTALRFRLHDANFDAPKLGGSPPLSVANVPRVSDQAAAAAQKILETPYLGIGREHLRAAEFLHPGVSEKLASIKEPTYSDFRKAMGYGDDLPSSWEFQNLLRDTAQDIQLGKVPLFGPPAPPKFIAPPEGSWAHYKNTIEENKNSLYAAADEFHDIAESHVGVLQSIADQAAFWKKAKNVADHMQANWKVFSNPHKTFEKAMQDIIAEVVGKP